MITVNVIQRVFHIKVGSSIATCFTIDLDNKQYFITAKHVVAGLKSGDSIELSYRKGWEKFDLRLIAHSPTADISVFVLPYAFPCHPMPVGMDKIIYGQDVYFLGFPYGLKSDVGPMNRDFPIPMVKKAIVSNIIFEPEPKTLFLDGINNQGFSGGPVVFKELGDSQEFKVAAVISGYLPDIHQAYIGNLPSNIEVRSNSGIIIAYDIKIAENLIKANPHGMAIS